MSNEDGKAKTFPDRVREMAVETCSAGSRKEHVLTVRVARERALIRYLPAVGTALPRVRAGMSNEDGKGRTSPDLAGKMAVETRNAGSRRSTSIDAFHTCDPDAPECSYHPRRYT